MASTDEIVRTIVLRARPSVVWDAIADARKFGEWFRCTIDGPFVVNQINNCRSTYPGSEDAEFQILVTAIEPETYFAYSWSPGDDGTGADQLDQDIGETLVEFTLKPTSEGTELTIRESGFDALPDTHRGQSYRRNSEGWDIQATNIADYVDG